MQDDDLLVKFLPPDRVRLAGVSNGRLAAPVLVDPCGYEGFDAMSRLLAVLVGMLLASSCATMNRIASEQEEEMRGATPAALSSGVNSRWETGNWEYDYASE